MRGIASSFCFCFVDGATVSSFQVASTKASREVVLVIGKSGEAVRNAKAVGIQASCIVARLLTNMSICPSPCFASFQLLSQ